MGKPGTDFGKVIDSILDRLDSLEVRTLALEEATPPGTLPNEVRWRTPLVKLTVATSGASISASWQPNGAGVGSKSVSLALDGGIQETCQAGDVKQWNNVPHGQHVVSCFVDGVEETRETFNV